MSQEIKTPYWIKIRRQIEDRLRKDFMFLKLVAMLGKFITDDEKDGE